MLLASIASSSSQIIDFLTLHQLALLYKKVNLIVAGESLSSHLGGWSGTKTIVLYGGLTDHRRWKALGNNVTLVKKDVACAPCFVGCSTRECYAFQASDIQWLI